MTLSYNQVAARGLERIAALSDVLFVTRGLAWRSLRPWRSRPVGPRDTRQRFFVAQALYAFGALLGVTSTYLGTALGMARFASLLGRQYDDRTLGLGESPWGGPI